MSETNNPSTLPRARVKEGRRWSLLWILPILTLLIGVGLAWQYWLNKGETIEIIFKEAQGLIAGKTVLRYREVDIGRVTAVKLSENLKDVIVAADVAPEARELLRENSLFWVVRPRVSISGVSGLSTLLSGPYITMRPGDGPPTGRFVATDTPPVSSDEQRGRRISLKSSSAGSVRVGSQVLFRQQPVGQVESIKFSDDYATVDFAINVEEPYTQLLNKNPYFWNASGIDFKASAQGFAVHLDSVETILNGGIEFDIDESGPEKEITDGAVYTLYNTENDAINYLSDRGITQNIRFVTYFDESLRGLTVGAPVEYNGLVVGKVIKIAVDYNEEKNIIKIPVTIELQPQRIFGDVLADPMATMTQAVKDGLRVRLQSGNFLTGQLFVELVDDSDDEAREIIDGGIYPELPSVRGKVEALFDKVNNVVDKINDLEIEALLANANSTITTVNRSLEDLNVEQLGKTLNTTLQDIQSASSALQRLSNQPDLQRLPTSALAAVDSMQSLITDLRGSVDELLPAVSGLLNQGNATVGAYGKRSTIYLELNQTLDAVQSASRSVKDLADRIERDPNSILFGRN